MLYGEVVDIAKEAGALIRTVKVRFDGGQVRIVDVTQTVVEAVEFIDRAVPLLERIWNWLTRRKKPRT